FILYSSLSFVGNNPPSRVISHFTLSFYFDCLRQILSTVVYVSSVEASGYVASSDRSAQAHCVASASGTCPADAPSCRTDIPRARSPQCLGESGVTSSLATSEE